MIEDYPIGKLVLSIALASFAIAFSAELFQNLLTKLKKYRLKNKMNKAIEESNIDYFTEGLIENSIMKLSAEDDESRKIAINELHFEWRLAKKNDKDKIVEELIKHLQKETNMTSRKAIIELLQKFLNE